MSTSNKTSRPQVGIDRLPARRMSNEPRESMNCKSCRKRKIKCNRLRPTCEACQVFQCACIYDAIPKKRGPKTDVLEALLKRVDGLEKRLRDEKKSTSPVTEENVSIVPDEVGDKDIKPQEVPADTSAIDDSAIYTPSPRSEPSPTVSPDILLDTFFTRIHGKPFCVLDETSTRQRLQLNQLPNFLLYAIFAISSRCTPHPNGYRGAVGLSEDYARRSRAEVDIDDPTIDGIQTLLLLSLAVTASGNGKKAYMLLTSAIAMAIALELHREFDMKIRATPVEREMRRRLFWTCYLMDRFSSSGSKRPSLISDKSILLRLPSWSPAPNSLAIEGEFFQDQYHSGAGKRNQGSSGMLIDIARILGITNRYLAAGGVKGDSHFPWHALSNLSKIRQDLDIWASGTTDVFTNIDSLFGQSDSTTLVLSKLIYHLIHCLIYRPFLPIDLTELAGTGQHQSWQIEATNLCFLHANAITELVELGKQSVSIEWPAFVGYCICTAGTVHVHGAHYKGGREGEVFLSSTDLLSREMQQLSELRYNWASVQHQRETLQALYACHTELVKGGIGRGRYSPVFHLEDFFDRYSTLGQRFDGAHVSFAEINVELSQEGWKGHGLYAPQSSNTNNNNGTASKRKASSSSVRRKDENNNMNGSGGSHDHTLKSFPPRSNSHGSHIHQPPPIQQSYMNQSAPPAPAAVQAPGPFSPGYNFNPDYENLFMMPPGGFSMDQHSMDHSMDQHPMTPGARSANGSAASGQGGQSGQEEKDPFLSLLEQIAENEGGRGGASELDYYLSGQGG